MIQHIANLSPNPTQIVKVLVALLVSISLTYLIASLCLSAFVLIALVQAGADIPIDMWLHTFWNDLYGHTFSGYVPYSMSIATAFLIAMPSAAIVHKVVGLPRPLLYPLAGAVAMATMLYIARVNFFDMSLWAGSRSAAGFGVQMFTGAMGGMIFMLLLNRIRRQ